MIFFSICESEQNIFQEFFFHVWNWDKKGKKNSLEKPLFVSHMKIKRKEHVKINKLKKYKHFSFSLLKKHFFLKCIYFFS